jgi:glycosyltransferase involved in cell wall biosynthesis
VKPQLSICIPTYNRSKFLNECLQSLLPQVKNHSVEVIVIDNASPDQTSSVVHKFQDTYPFLLYFRNSENLGYTGNQIKCFEYAQGDYIATLMDDDIYMEGELERIMKVIKEREYAFIALNYYGFIKNQFKPYLQNFAPEKDKIFKRAYDLWNYPSVGHFSGYVFNAKISKAILQEILPEKPISYYEKRRGIIGHVAALSMLSSDLPAYFIGYRGLACYMPMSTDYDSLQHLCIDYYEFDHDLYSKGLITQSDLEWRATNVLHWLPKALLRNGGFLNSESLSTIEKKLTEWFRGRPRYDNLCLPIIRILRYPSARFLARVIVSVYQFLKKFYRKLRFS